MFSTVDGRSLTKYRKTPDTTKAARGVAEGEIDIKLVEVSSSTVNPLMTSSLLSSEFPMYSDVKATP